MDVEAELSGTDASGDESDHGEVGKKRNNHFFTLILLYIFEFIYQNHFIIGCYTFFLISGFLMTMLQKIVAFWLACVLQIFTGL